MTTETQQATPDAGAAPQGQTPPATTETAPQGATGREAAAPQAPKQTADDLDALLREFETPAKAPDPSVKPSTGDGTGEGGDSRNESGGKLTPDRLYQVVDFVERAAAQSVRADIDAAVATAKRNEGLRHLPDEMVREMLEGSAASDKRLRSAWLMRHDRPEAWTRLVEGWAAKKADAFKSLPDPGLSQDREALAAAVRGQGATQLQPQAKTPQEVHAMSDQEFRAWKDRQLGA